MRTPDLSSFEHMSYTSPPQYPLGSRIGCFETGSENNGFDEPPPAPLAPSSTVPPPPLQYRTIKPRLSGHGTVPTTPQENLASLSQPDSTQMPASSLVLNPGARGLNRQVIRNCHRS
ncbi:uncharacterized protein N7515_001280 [Penicillium bovifimosum]|uniref:Uncharacterized protein n=1 Tax=Penicillium bovifimosum TaxID=126998 RepID=A0A9W9HB86_9EURO|nr:uncharacterized protein N7515_001280 [Penicillium bovifimosum]KAJ5142493.1 hypothetical protein N7515_001280 [Penicillium bovifimosum]